MAFRLDTHRELTQVTTLEDTALGIMRWGRSNSFPQTLKNLIEQSPSAKPAIERTARFYKGGEFEGQNVIINNNGLTLRDLVDHCANELAMFGGLSFHQNFNAKYLVSSINLLKMTDIRLESFDELDSAGQIGYHPNFGLNSVVKKTITNTPTKSSIKFLPRTNYNAVELQAEAVGGLSKYLGQAMYYSGSGFNSYPIPPLQSPINFVLSDVENSILVRKETSTGFISSYILKTTLDAESPTLTKMEESLSAMQGARGLGKIVTFSGLPSEDVNSTMLEQIGGGAGEAGNIINAARLAYELDREAILGAYLIPPILGGMNTKSAFTTSELEDAYFVFNSITEEGRQIIESNINRMLENSAFPVKEIELNKLTLDVAKEGENV